MGLKVGLVTSYDEETPVEPLNGIQIISWDRLPGRSAWKPGLIFSKQPCVYLSRAG
jgi:hypothetical protein